MRPEEDRLERRARPGAFPENVARDVDGHVKPSLAHEPHHVLAALLVELAVGRPTHTAIRILAELGQRDELLVDPVAIHAERVRILRSPRRFTQGGRSNAGVAEGKRADGAGEAE